MGTIHDILTSIESLEPFPPVAVQIFQLALLDDALPSQLVEIIETDPGVTTKVLRLANSAAFGPRVEVASLHDAANRLGTRILTSMVWTSIAQGFYAGLGQSNQGSNRQLWEEVATNAIASRMIAAAGGKVDPHMAFTLGLVQNIGHLILDRFLVSERESIQREIDNGKSPINAERAVLGIHHAELGARLAKRWSFPAVLVQAIRYHHAPHRAGEHKTAAAIGNVGEAFAAAVLSRKGPDTPTYGMASGAAELALVSREEFPALRDLLIAELDRYRDLIGGSTASEAA